MLRKIRHLFWPPVDSALVDAGRDGELTIARTRIVIVALWARGPAATLVRTPGSAPAALALVVEILVVAFAVTLLQLATRHPPVPWLGFASAALDVSFVSFYHATVFSGAFAQLVLTSRAAFALYLLAILATSLRNDGRVATFAGLLAASEWMLVVHSWSAGALDRMGEFDELLIILAA